MPYAVKDQAVEAMARKIKLRPGERLYVERAGIPGWLFWLFLVFGVLSAIGPVGLIIAFVTGLALTPISKEAKLALAFIGLCGLADWLFG